MRAAIVLAAGEGRRFGRLCPKPLAVRRGRRLIVRAIDIARFAPAARLLVVVGRQGDRVAAVVRRADPRAVVVRNRRWRDGQASSLAAAARALWPVERQVFVFLADMPAVPPLLAGRLARAGGIGARGGHLGQPGHPVLIPRGMLAANRGRRAALPLVEGGPGACFDIDRHVDLDQPIRL